MNRLEDLREEFLAYMHSKIEVKEPETLYKPIQYILELGGKRLRPVLTILTASLFKTPHEKAMDAALAVELFHNFSLIHDDIMDNAPLRRGKETVHEKWDLNTGILSGDAMLILAYQLFENYPPETFRELAKLFSKTALEVCEGQQYDIDFEDRENVSIADYTKMINYKTAVLLGAAMKMGAIIADASESCREKVYEFGRNLGIAFQLQDDYLDVFGDPETFGKQVGGDIIENKKTFMYLYAIHNAPEKESQELKHLYSILPQNPKDKIEAVKHFFTSSGAGKATKEEIKKFTEKANSSLENLKVSEESKKLLLSISDSLMHRTV